MRLPDPFYIKVIALLKYAKNQERVHKRKDFFLIFFSQSEAITPSMFVAEWKTSLVSSAYSRNSNFTNSKNRFTNFQNSSIMIPKSEAKTTYQPKVW